jgi:hypothetical protein
VYSGDQPGSALRGVAGQQVRPSPAGPIERGLVTPAPDRAVVAADEDIGHAETVEVGRAGVLGAVSYTI